MRVRTADRRQEILNAAIEVFRDVGYERASMAMISAKVGGSKTTLYGYFPSKEELFSVAMVEAVQQQGQKALAILDTTSLDAKRVLRQFGEAYLRVVTSDNAIALTRTIVAEAAQHEAAAQAYEQGAQRIADALTTYLSHIQKQGMIRPVDLRIAATHFEGLLNGGILMPLLFGARPELKRNEAVRAAVDAFLSAYGTSE